MKTRTSVEIDGINELVESNVQVALAEALTKNSDRVIKEIVRAALCTTETYSRETVLTKALKTAIQEKAKEEVAKWVEKNQSKIAQEVEARINKQLSPEMMADTIVKQLAKITVNYRPFDPHAEQEEMEDQE
jgi:hypothetical protein